MEKNTDKNLEQNVEKSGEKGAAKAVHKVVTPVKKEDHHRDGRQCGREGPARGRELFRRRPGKPFRSGKRCRRRKILPRRTEPSGAVPVPVLRKCSLPSD